MNRRNDNLNEKVKIGEMIKLTLSVNHIPGGKIKLLDILFDVPRAKKYQAVLKEFNKEYNTLKEKLLNTEV